MNKDYESMFGMKTCIESVRFDVEVLGQNPFEELGRSIIRADQDVFFNRIMIDAWKKYIEDNELTWDHRD